MKHYNLIALTNPLDGQEDAFNAWYDDVHIGDVFKLPGVVGAQRFRLSDTQYREAPTEWKYMAVYEIETDDIEATFDALRKASGTETMPLSPALSADRMVWIYEPILSRRAPGQ